MTGWRPPSGNGKGHNRGLGPILLLCRLWLLLSCYWLWGVEGCPIVQVRSSRLRFLEGTYVLTGYGATDSEPKEGEEPVVYAQNERPVYVSEAEPYRYLYHMQVGMGLILGLRGVIEVEEAV